VALAIRNKWPIVFDEYKGLCDAQSEDWHLLGETQIVEVAEDLFVCNVFSQYDYGIGQKHTEYSAIKTALTENIPHEQVVERNLPCYFPMRFGSDRGGGDWNIVSRIIEYYIPDAIICKLP